MSFTLGSRGARGKLPPFTVLGFWDACVVRPTVALGPFYHPQTKLFGKQSLFEYFLGLIEGRVDQRVTVDSDNFVSHRQSAVSVNATSWFYALNYEPAVLIAWHNVNPQGTNFILYDNLKRGFAVGRRRRG